MLAGNSTPGAQDWPAGGYRFIPAVSQYSAGVAALPGHAIERVRLSDPVPLRAGFELIAKDLKEAGRPLAALCACELRSPKPFSEEGFEAFNRAYVGFLDAWGLLTGGDNPVARSNVCPELEGPPEPSFHAFCFTRAAPGAAPSFVIAGSAEAPEGRGKYTNHIVARGDVTTAGLQRKADFVITEMERRMAFFQAGWRQTTATQLYTIHDVHSLIGDQIVRRGAARHGLTWHFSRPPVIDLEFEMDCRLVATERVIIV